MIGGHDVSLLGPVLSDDMDVLLRSARAAWPHAILESGDGETLVSIGDALRLRWSTASEVFIYEGRAAYESWTACGLTDENADQMVAITVEPDCISFVVSGPKTSTGSIVDGMIEAVKANRWLALAPRAA